LEAYLYGTLFYFIKCTMSHLYGFSPTRVYRGVGGGKDRGGGGEGEGEGDGARVWGRGGKIVFPGSLAHFFVPITLIHWWKAWNFP
jgi:hypothetical protein